MNDENHQSGGFFIKKCPEQPDKSKIGSLSPIQDRTQTSQRAASLRGHYTLPHLGSFFSSTLLIHQEYQPMFH